MKKKIISFFFVSLFILGLSKISKDEEQPDKDKPNILFIAIDEMNDWVGYLRGHGGMEVYTPNIDRLARESMIFTNAYNCSNCHTFWSPS